MTLYKYIIKPFLPIGTIEANEDLKKLNYTSDLLLNNPDKKYRTNFWKYIDGKGYDRIDDKISTLGFSSCISGGLFRIFNSNEKFFINFSEDKNCALCGYSSFKENVNKKSLIHISNDDIKLQTMANIIAYKLMDYISTCPKCYKKKELL